MAEDERVPEAERRRLAREQRKQKQAEGARRARRQRIVSGLSVGAALAFVGVLVGMVLSTSGEESTAEAIVLARDKVSASRAAAGCEVVSDAPVAEPSTHYDAATAPSADELYRDPRPANSGPHFAVQHPIIRRVPDDQLEERALTHNLEHGAIIAWYDPEQVDDATVDQMGQWSEQLMASGFIQERAGTGIFVTPYTDPGITSGKAIAYRGWGYSLDCATWDPMVANSVVLDAFGSNGTAPEGSFAPFPAEQMRYEGE